MTASLAAGALAGLGALAISEALLRFWRGRPEVSALAVALAGMGLRAAWILSALALGLASGALAAAPYTAGLLGAYLAVQTAEGLRYRSHAERR